MEVKFYDEVKDELLKYAVIVAISDGKFVFCKHKDRNTYEIPGGHRENGESILSCARRELSEETGALDYVLKKVCVYSVKEDEGNETFGMLYYADVFSFEESLHHEIKEIILSEERIDNWTYPSIQPKLIDQAGKRGFL